MDTYYVVTGDSADLAGYLVGFQEFREVGYWKIREAIEGDRFLDLAGQHDVIADYNGLRLPESKVWLRLKEEPRSLTQWVLEERLSSIPFCACCEGELTPEKATFMHKAIVHKTCARFVRDNL